MAERDRHTKEIALKGKWISDLDGVVVAENFTTLRNLRYTDVYPRAVGGMTKRNSTALSNHTVRNAHHFRRPSTGENHLLMQADPGTGAYGAVQTFESTIPNTSNTVYNLYVEAINGPTGRFSDVPGGGIAYCNEVNSLIWSGYEMRVGAVINEDILYGTYFFDYTDKLNNSLTDNANIAWLSADEDDLMTLRIGCVRPIYGVNFTVGTANTITTGYWNVAYWDGEMWEDTSTLVDTTATLTKSGYLTFSSSVGLCKLSYKYGLLLYWYQVDLYGFSGGSLSEITLRTEMQPINDIWDGVELSVTGWYRNDEGVWYDDTLNVYTNDYDSTNDLTYSDISILNGTDYVIAGFPQRMIGVHLYLPTGLVNTQDDVSLEVSYWNGANWVVLPSIVDGTSIDYTMTLGKSGVITWPDPGEALEYTTTIYNDVPMFYYKIESSAALAGGPVVYHVTGLPAAQTIKPFKFPVYAMDRLMLCNSVSDYPNRVLVSAQTSDCVFNGDDAVELYVGDENAITGAAWLYSQFGSSLYNVVVFTKFSETWLLSGNDPESWTLYRASANIGCPAPLTIKVINAPQEMYQQSNRTIAIWQGANGIYIFDGKAFTPIHNDIEDWFDQKKSYAITPAQIGTSSAFYDDLNQEYHWIFKSGTAANLKEFVYDMRRKKWYEMNRGTGKGLVLATQVQDTLGNTYCYGFTSDGYIQRLEYGNTFDGNAMLCELQTGDIALHQGSMWETTKIRNVKLVTVGKTTTANSVTMTHYGDTSGTGTAFSLDPTPGTGQRISSGRVSANLGDYVFHRFGLSLSTTDEKVGFEPIYLGVIYETIRKDTRVDT